MTKHSPRLFGFTLLELLVVISIIGILVAMGAASFSVAQKQGRDARRRADMKTFQNCMEQASTLLASGHTYTYAMRNTCLASITPPVTGNYSATVGTDAAAFGVRYCACALLDQDTQGNGGGCTADGLTGGTIVTGSTTHFCVSGLQ